MGGVGVGKRRFGRAGERQVAGFLLLFFFVFIFIILMYFKFPKLGVGSDFPEDGI